MRRFLFGFLIGVVAVPLAVYAYFAFGMAPVATAAPDMPFEKMLAKKALHARLEKEMPKDVPLPWDEANFTAGAQTYIQHCAVCHGLPGQPQTAIASGMYPKPPQLFKGKGVTDDPPGATYWKGCQRHPLDRHARIPEIAIADPDVAGQYLAGQCRQLAARRQEYSCDGAGSLSIAAVVGRPG